MIFFGGSRPSAVRMSRWGLPGPAGTFRQTTEPGKPQRDILTALGLDPPKKIIEISPKP